MANDFQEPGESKIRFTGTLTDLVTMAKAAGRIMGDEDAIGERMVAMMQIDISPYKDFKSLRLALEKYADPDALMQIGRNALQEDLALINLLNDGGISIDDNGDEEEKADVDSGRLSFLVGMLNGLGISPKTMEPYKPANAFVILPEEPGDRIIWQASLADFCALVIMTGILELKTDQEEMPLYEELARRYCSIMEVDMGPFPDFRSLHAVYGASFDVHTVTPKAIKLAKAHTAAFCEGGKRGIKPYSAYEVQAIFNVQVAEALAGRWPKKDWEEFSHLLDILFMPDEAIDAVLGG